MLNYKIEIKEDIIITITKPEAPQEQIDDLENMKSSLDLHEFLDWVSWLPINPQDEEWAYWEARAGHLDLLVEQQEEIKRMQKEIRSLKEKLEVIEKENKELERIVDSKSWPAKSRVIALEEENQKLKNKLQAFQSPFRGRKKK